MAAYVALMVVLAFVFRSEARSWASIERRRVLVHVDGQTIDGILWKRRGPLLVLRSASMLSPQGGAVPIDGEVVVERHRVSWMQVLS